MASLVHHVVHLVLKIIYIDNGYTKYNKIWHTFIMQHYLFATEMDTKWKLSIEIYIMAHISTDGNTTYKVFCDRIVQFVTKNIS